MHSFQTGETCKLTKHWCRDVYENGRPLSSKASMQPHAHRHVSPHQHFKKPPAAVNRLLRLATAPLNHLLQTLSDTCLPQVLRKPLVLNHCQYDKTVMFVGRLNLVFQQSHKRKARSASRVMPRLEACSTSKTGSELHFTVHKYFEAQTYCTPYS